MAIHRLKHTFTSGELSPLLSARVDFTGYNNGCSSLTNMVCLTQGPATSRSGFEFIIDLASVGQGSNTFTRVIPFVFSEIQAYAMVFFYDTADKPRAVLATGSGIVVYADPAPTECPVGTPIVPAVNPGDPVILTFHDDFSLETFDWAQSADIMYFAQAGLAPQAITRLSHYCWQSGDVNFTAEPADWVDGYPERVTFHQQRLVYAASAAYRQTVWMSQSGDFQDFSVSVGDVLPSDAITFTLDSGTQNKILWLNSTRTLNIGTLGNEWTVTGSGDAALEPSNILAQRHTNRGSEPVNPLVIGTVTVYLERFGRAVNEFMYDYNVGGNKSVDISVLAEHLTRSSPIVDWTYQQTPDSIIWSIREDGVMLGLTYQKTHQVVGWHKHTTQGKFQSITSIPGDSREDEIWVVVERELPSGTKFYLEKLALRFNSEHSVDGRFMDSFLAYDGAPVSSLSGLDHLEGLTVGILADGTVHPDCPVVSGSVELNNEYSKVVIGMNFVAEVAPLLPDITTTTGTSIGSMQRITSIDVDFYQTLGVWFGREDSEDGEYEEEIAFRVPGDLMGQAVPLFTGIRHIEFPEGFDRNSNYFIRQYQPLPLTVRGVVDTVEVRS